MKGSWSVVEKNETGVETLVPIDLRVLATRIVDASYASFRKIGVTEVYQPQCTYEQDTDKMVARLKRMAVRADKKKNGGFRLHIDTK